MQEKNSWGGTVAKQVIRLTASEMKKAGELAKGREDVKTIPNPRGWNNESRDIRHKYIDNNKYLPNFLGIVGEIAYARFIGGEIDESLYATHGDDGSGDVGSVEVKVSTFMTDDVELKIPERDYKDKMRPDKYVLCRVNRATPSVVEIIGEVSAERFDAEKKVKQYRPDAPINYVMSGRDLDEVAFA